MRIALLSRAVFGLHGFGGMERHVLELARFLARAGAEVTLFTRPPTREANWDERDVELRVVNSTRLPLRGILDRSINYPIWAKAAGKVVAAGEFDVVHAQGASGWGYAGLRARGRARAPLVVNPQGMEEFKTTWLKRMAYTPLHLAARETARRAAAVIAADSAAVTEIPQFLHVPASKVVLIPNGMDVDAALSWVQPEIMRAIVLRYGLQQSTPFLLSVGRLEANKGFDVLLEALARIRPSLPSRWACLIVGEGPLRASLQARVNSLRLHHHIQLIGAVDDSTLHNLYELATLFVHPTLFEGSSLVTLEAMAHRRAIIASAVGGIPDKVVRGRNGYLIAPGDPQELGDKILLSLRDPTRLREMGAASYEIVRARFDWPSTIQQTLALYGRLTAQGAF